MIKLLILYAPDSSGMKKLIGHLQNAFDKKIFKVACKSALKSHVPDVAATDAVIFGSSIEDGGEIHSDFAELIRAFSGMNLAGRCAAVFCENDTTAAVEFTKALTDTDIALYSEPLLLQEKNSEPEKIKRWATQFASFVKKNLHG